MFSGSAWVLSRSPTSSHRPITFKLRVSRLIGHSKLPVGVDGCLCLHVGPAVSLQCPCLQPPCDPKQDKRWKTDNTNTHKSVSSSSSSSTSPNSPKRRCLSDQKRAHRSSLLTHCWIVTGSRIPVSKLLLQQVPTRPDQRSIPHHACSLS